MLTVLQHIRRHLRLPPRERPPYYQLLRTEWCRQFEQLMRNRLILGSLRYETFDEKFRTDHDYKIIDSCIKRLELYNQTGNTEHLVDVANLCMLEFNSPSNPKAHWEARDDAPIHVEKKT